jgi:hypothetical protein
MTVSVRVDDWRARDAVWIWATRPGAGRWGSVERRTSGTIPTGTGRQDVKPRTPTNQGLMTAFVEPMRLVRVTDCGMTEVASP